MRVPLQTDPLPYVSKAVTTKLPLAAERPNVYSSSCGKKVLAPEERNVPLGETKHFAPYGASKFFRVPGSINISSLRDRKTGGGKIDRLICSENSKTTH